MMDSMISNLPWPAIKESLWTLGYARLGQPLERSQCEELRSLYTNRALFRSRIDMARFRFGRGEYQYFSYPLPPLVTELRQALYRPLAVIANEWMPALSLKGNFPSDLSKFLDHCHARGQK